MINLDGRKTDGRQRHRVIAAIHDDIDAIEAAWPRIQHAAYTQQRGYPSQTAGSSGSYTTMVVYNDKGEIVDISTDGDGGSDTLVERHAFQICHSEQAKDWFVEFRELIAQARRLASMAAELAAHQPPMVDESECLACGRFVSGTPNDRLRKGLCDMCRMRWTREGNPDRAAWIAAQKHKKE